MKRRQALLALAATLAGQAVQAHDEIGPVEPASPAIDLELVGHDGRPKRLRTLLEGNVTLVQTIFTGCSSVCPVQGALFAEIQRRVLAKAPRMPVRLLSVSIDALGDTPQSLARWLGRMEARQPAWGAAVPRTDDVAALLAWLDGAPTPATTGDHSQRVYFVDERARLRWRTGPLPSAHEVERVLRHLAA